MERDDNRISIDPLGSPESVAAALSGLHPVDVADALGRAGIDGELLTKILGELDTEIAAEVIISLDEHTLGEVLDVLDLPCHFSPHALVLRHGAVGPTRFTQQFVDHFVRRTAKAINAVDGAHARHLLLVGLLAFAPPTPARSGTPSARPPRPRGRGSRS